jgi:hypothetical protein
MSIRFKCSCGAHHEVRESLAGKTATCKECGKSFMIPVKPADFEGKSKKFNKMPDMADGAMDPPPF